MRLSKSLKKISYPIHTYTREDLNLRTPFWEPKKNIILRILKKIRKFKARNFIPR